MTLYELIETNYITIGTIFGLILLIISNKIFSEKTNGYFLSIAGIMLAIDVADIVNTHYTALGTNATYVYFAYAVSNTLKPIVVMLLINIVRRRKKPIPLLWAPIILNGLLFFTNIHTHIIFTLDSALNYIPGIFPYSAQLISVLYLIYLVIISTRMYKNNPQEEGIALVYLATFATVAVILETVHRFNFLLPGTVISCCALYYNFLSAQIFRRDELTGLLNRRSFFLAAREWQDEILPIISIDLNGLKDINDLHGHQAGDIALQTFTNIIQSITDKNYYVYRIGGDEFMVIARHKSTVEAQQFLTQVRSALALTEYSASFGLALYTPGADFDTICNQADKRMYIDKRNFRHRATIQEDMIARKL